MRERDDQEVETLPQDLRWTMILRERGKYILYTKDGKRILGRHRSLVEALAQEHAIRISKARFAGHRIPK